MSRPTLPAIALAALAAVALLAGPARAQNFLVVPSASHPTIQSAINAAVNGDTVVVAPGTYVENIDFLGKEIHVLGAGAGLSFIDGNNQGAVCSFVGGEGPGAVLEGFTLRNGSGRVIAQGMLGPLRYGGAVVVYGAFNGPGSFPSACPTIARCEITASAADLGGGVCVNVFARAFLTECHIHGNQAADFQQTGNGGLGGGVFSGSLSEAVITDCLIEGNQARFGGGVGQIGASVEIERTTVAGNAAAYMGMGEGGGVYMEATGFGYAPAFRRSVFRDNTADGEGGGVTLKGSSTTTYLLENCIIAGNLAVDGAGLHGYFGATMQIRHVTVGANVASSPTGAAVKFSASAIADVKNGVFWGDFPAEIVSTSGASVSVTFSDVAGGHPGTGNFDADPLFRSPATGDFDLFPGTPCAEAGAVFPGLPNEDFAGRPRLVYTAPDAGAYEVTDIYLDPSVAGNVGLGAGGPFDVLTVNGSAGGLTRRVAAAVGQPLITAMSRPPTNPAPAGFAIFGILGVPDHQTPTALPFGIGTMSFPPCPMVPALEGLLFTLTNNLLALPCTSLIPSTPAPWSTGLQPGLPFPVELMIQGVIEESPGVVRVTNGIVLVVS